VPERERIWTSFRASTIDPPDKAAFDKFWDAQHGVRSLFLMDNLSEFSAKVPFKVYGRALEWGYPMGVGYRYLTLSQSLLLLRVAPVSLRSGKKPHRGGFSAVPRGRGQETGWERKLISQPLPAAAMAC
jgi:hypothetical protein